MKGSTLNGKRICVNLPPETFTQFVTVDHVENFTMVPPTESAQFTVTGKSIDGRKVTETVQYRRNKRGKVVHEEHTVVMIGTPRKR